MVRSPLGMSVALQVGGAPLPAGGGSGWPAERRACRAAGGQQRRAPAPPPGRRFSLITLVNVIHSDRAVFGTHSGPAPPTTPSPPRQRHKADSVGTSDRLVSCPVFVNLHASSALTPAGIQGSLGMTQVHPELTAAQGFGIEVLITFVLVFVVFGVCDEKRTDVLGAGPLAIGLAVTTCHVGALKCTGASMNPARSFGPAVVTGIWANHWVFWAGPLLGGLLAAVLYSLAFRADRLGSPRSTGDENKPEKYEP
ncbi:Aquaporin AQPAe.a [Amphibalanus amphitrite]|uniref:Aquaporin AQPAe.a n=1 Tax=Amphibalanus amphitrite TaxID=1232801 RepID=A0A6A4VBV6_AMPAM|nr:Aquaporin AQPAe.a [Amphibalanus amphitrite]